MQVAALFGILLALGCFHSCDVTSHYVTSDVTLLNRTHCSPGDTQPSNRVNTTQRVQNLLPELVQHDLDAYIIPTEDAHQNEYVSDADRRLLYMSGFSGNSGVGVVLAGGGRAVWTDGRYFQQADQQLDCGWMFMKQDTEGYPTATEWLASQLPPGSTVGCDPTLVGAKRWLQMQEELSVPGISLVGVVRNLVDDVWEEDEQGRRPQYMSTPLFVHDIEYAGENWPSKVTRVLTWLARQQKPMAVVVTALDEVAWLLNLRGGAFEYTPLFFSYVIFTGTELRIYANLEEINEAVLDHLDTGNITYGLYPYSDMLRDLDVIAAQPAIQRVLVPGAYSYAAGASYAIYTIVPSRKRFVAPSPIVDMKSRKNPTEVARMKDAHLRDGAAMTRALARLEGEIKSDIGWDELSAGALLDESRSHEDLYWGRSFETTSAYGPNAALIHYKSSNSTNVRIGTDSLYLVDTGGQYYDGTTDMSRTLYYGSQPPQDMREMYTRVLMGHIDLATLTFPAGTPDTRTDVLARRHLHAVGKDYRHGTGHGVGMFLSAHEAPLQVRLYGTEEHPYELGHFFSNEPGYYEDGRYGIRLENVMTVIDAQMSFDVPFYEFEAVTLVPFEPVLIDTTMLSQAQCSWLDSYHQRVQSSLAPLMSDDVVAIEWLAAKTAKLCL